MARSERVPAPRRTARVHRRFLEGAQDGIPIFSGYLAVSFSLGIFAGGIGLSAFQGFLASLLNNASAGEYAGFTMIAADASYVEIVLMTLIANARYLLMSTALSQKFSPRTPFFHRLLIGYDLTDELFGLAVSRNGDIDPPYMYGAISVALVGWSVGTALGILAGNLLPVRVVEALSVAIYGMFIAIIIPPARRNRVVAGLVALSFAASFAFAVLPVVSSLSEGTRTLLLTVVISGGAAALFPVEPPEQEGGAAS